MTHQLELALLATLIRNHQVILVQTSIGTVPAVFGEWNQGDKQFRRCLWVLSSDETPASRFCSCGAENCLLKENWMLISKKKLPPTAASSKAPRNTT